MSKNKPSVFSLECQTCDAGTEIKSAEVAIRLGWVDLQYTPDLPQCNWLGRCPDCQLAEAQQSVDGMRDDFSQRRRNVQGGAE